MKEKRMEPISGAAIRKAEENARKKNPLNFLQQQELERKQDALVPGLPTAGKILIGIKENEIQNETRDILQTNTNIHQVLACHECNDTRIKEGAWIQLQKQAAMEDLEWGSKKMMLVREHQVVFVFDIDPRQQVLDWENELRERDNEKIHNEEVSNVSES